MKDKLKDYIQNNLDELDIKKPGPLVLNRILEQMQTKEDARPKGILISFSTIKWAAACLLAIVCGLGIWQFHKPLQPAVAVNTKNSAGPLPSTPVRNKDTVQQTLVLHNGIDAVDKELEERKSDLVAEVKNKKLILFAGFSKIESAAGRINAVSETAASKNNGNDVTDALLQVLNNDPNTNVRLAALDGLAGFYKQPYTRKKLLASLKKQTDPVVQITLIGLLTKMREAGILTELEKIVHNENTDKGVKDCAYSSMLQLRS